jgi:hypothetical protein
LRQLRSRHRIGLVVVVSWTALLASFAAAPSASATNVCGYEDGQYSYTFDPMKELGLTNTDASFWNSDAETYYAQRRYANSNISYQAEVSGGGWSFFNSIDVWRRTSIVNLHCCDHWHYYAIQQNAQGSCL